MHRNGNTGVSAKRDELARLLPAELASLADPQTTIPALAKDYKAAAQIEQVVKLVPTKHRLFLGDSRELENIESGRSIWF